MIARALTSVSLTHYHSKDRRLQQCAGPSLNRNGKGTWRNTSSVSPTPRCSFRKYSKTPSTLNLRWVGVYVPGVFNQLVCWLQVVGVVVHRPLEMIMLGKAELFHRSPRPTETHMRAHTHAQASPQLSGPKLYFHHHHLPPINCLSSSYNFNLQ